MKGISSLVSLLLLCGSSALCFSQSDAESAGTTVKREVRGVVLNHKTKEPLPYANVVLSPQGTGTITNEVGLYSILIAPEVEGDSVSFHYLGYKTQIISARELDSMRTIYLQEEIFNLQETFVFGNEYDPKKIIEKVLEKQEENYKPGATRSTTFIRRRSTSDIQNLAIKFKKSTFDQIDRKVIQELEQKIPRHSTSYSDFLGNLYYHEKADSNKLKIAATKLVILQDKNVGDLDQLEKMFEDIMSDTDEDEYWKIKSGILGTKVHVDTEEEKAKRDSLKELNTSSMDLDMYGFLIESNLTYGSLQDKTKWEFLHNTGNYIYTLAGGTKVSGENVFIIDFTPKKSGLYEGRVYITMETFALLRADYNYAPGKVGRHIQLFGVGYAVTQFEGSIYFEKQGDSYQLKYLSNRGGTNISFDRKLSVLKKRKRFFIDKTLNEIDGRLAMSVHEEQSVEILVMKSERISATTHANFVQQKSTDIIYVDQFDDKLWSGYSIIEPTKQMKEYKKME